MSTVFLIILTVQRDVMRRKLQSRIPNRFWNLWMLIVDLELMKLKIMLQDPIYWYYYRIPLEFNIQVIVDVM